jgi:hypothetical protein
VLSDEWRLAGSVLLSACEALEVAPEAMQAVLRSVASAAAEIETLAAGGGPAGVIIVRQLGGFRPRDSRTGAPH